MKKEQEYLLKRFASILRAMALGKEVNPFVDNNVAHCLTRKDLIEIIKKCFGGTIPKEHNLIEMEKPELLSLIKNEMLIISYMTEKWSREGMVKEIPKKEFSKTENPKEKKSIQNPKKNSVK